MPGFNDTGSPAKKHAISVAWQRFGDFISESDPSRLAERITVAELLRSPVCAID